MLIVFFRSTNCIPQIAFVLGVQAFRSPKKMLNKIVSIFILDNLEVWVPCYWPNFSKFCPKWLPPAFMQLSVPNDITAITISVSISLMSKRLQHLLIFGLAAIPCSPTWYYINATLTAKLTQVSATMTAQTNSSSSVLNPVTHATRLFRCGESLGGPKTCKRNILWVFLVSHFINI